MTDFETLDLMGLPEATTVSPNAVVAVQEPEGPVQRLEIERLFAHVIVNDTAAATEADLQLIVADAANEIGLVFADPDPAKSGWYRSTAAGAGNWVQFEKLSAQAAAEVQGLLSRAQNAVPFDTWVELEAATGMADGDRATVDATDTGDHADPVTSLTVLNAGKYEYDDATPGWERTGDLDSQISKQWADQSEAAFVDLTRVSGNILDPSAAGWEIDRRINPPNGTAIVLAGWDSSPYIPVEAGKTYATNFVGFGAFYDEAQVYVSALDTAPGWVAPIITAPDDGFVRMSSQIIGNYARNLTFFQEGTEWPTEFVEPFGNLIDSGRLSKASADGFADGAVYPRKTAFWEKGENQANPVGRVDGFFLATNGSPSANATYSYWPAFEVEPGQIWTANQSMRFVTFLDAGGKAQSTIGISAPTTTFAVPDGAAFAVVTTTQSLVATFAVALGEDVPTFSEYGWDGRSELPDGTPLRWGVPDGGEIVAAVDEELASTAWRAAAAVPASYGLERLRETRQRLRSLGRGKIGIDARLTMALIGDSWTHDNGRYPSKVAQALWNKYHPGDPNENTGPIGLGWISFKGAGTNSFPNGAIYWNSYFVGGAGAWVSQNGVTACPDTGSESSSEVGAYLQPQVDFNYDAGFVYTLVAEGGAGVVRYRWTAAGAWTAVDLSALAAGVQVIEMAGMPVSGTGRFRIEVVSGTPKLYGMNERHPTSEGIIVHKLGATGTTLQQWANVNAAQWQVGIAALEPNLITILHGTNDQTGSRSKALFKADLITLIDRARLARPACDILLIAPAENQRINAVPMNTYAEAMYEIARDDRDVAFLNLQQAFGANPEDYEFGSARPWFAADGIHPEPTSGGWAMTDAILGGIGERN